MHMDRLLAITAAALATGVLAVPASAGVGRDRLVVQSHGERMRALLQDWEWCPERSTTCASGVADYAYDPNPRRLAFHPGSVIRLRTAAGARRVSVVFSRAAGEVRVRANRRSSESTLWTLRAPADVDPEQDLDLSVDYRYRKNGKVYGGKYNFALPVRQHIHR